MSPSKTRGGWSPSNPKKNSPSTIPSHHAATGLDHRLHIPKMHRTLSPRVRRVLQRTLNGDQLRHWDEHLPEHVDSIMAVTTLFATGDALADTMQVDKELATTVWEAIDQEADAIEEMRAKVRMLAQRHAGTPTPVTGLSTSATRTRWTTTGTKRARTSKPRGDDAQEEADDKLERAIEEAFALADQAAGASRRLKDMAAMQLTADEQKGLMRNMFLHKVGVASTMETHLRNLARLRRWAAGKGVDPWTASPLHLACFLRDESRGGPTVGMGLRSSLAWFDFALNLGWNLSDPLVISVAGKDRRQARAGREQARPYTQEIVDTLIAFHADAQGAEKFAAGFALTQAMAVLRFSDLDRTKGMNINGDALFGMTWKSKTKQEGMPWAMPRRTWADYDVGGEHFRTVEALLGTDSSRNWQWPAMLITQGQLQMVQPPRHGSYGNCLMAHNLVLRKAGVEGDFTLHSPRFYLPGLAGQVGMSLEQRRTLGHWGPNSNMPVRYDQARCCTELKMKGEIWQRLAGGWKPAQDFHLPAVADIQHAAQEMHTQRQKWHETTKSTTDQEADQAHVIINHKSMMLHRASPGDPRKSACPYARTQRAHMQATTEVKENLNMYTRCMAAACFGRPGPNPPTWTSAEGSGSESSAGTHAGVSSSDGSSGTNSS